MAKWNSFTRCTRSGSCGTESNHFAHAVAAVNEFTTALQIEVDPATARDIFAQYLQRKASVMSDCAQLLG